MKSFVKISAKIVVETPIKTSEHLTSDPRKALLEIARVIIANEGEAEFDRQIEAAKDHLGKDFHQSVQRCYSGIEAKQNR